MSSKNQHAQDIGRPRGGNARARAVLIAVSLLCCLPMAARGQSHHLEGCPPDLAVLVERPFATSRGLETGDRLRVRGSFDGVSCEATVSGLFEPPADPSRLTIDRPRVLFHLSDLADLTGRTGEVDHFTIRLRPDVASETIIGPLASLLPGTQVLTTAEVADGSSTTFAVVSRFHRAIGIITLVAGGVFLACIMILKVQERRAAVSAARLVGVPRRTLLGWTIAEAGLLSTLGGLIGLGLGLTASVIINGYYQRVYDTRLVFSHVTGEMILQALALALVLGMAAGVLAGVRLVSADALTEVGR